MLLGIKVLRMLDEIESYLRLPPFVFRMSRLFFIIFYSVHITCCTFWLIKVSMLHVTYPSIHRSMIDGAIYVLGLRKNKCPSRCPRTQTTRLHPLTSAHAALTLALTCRALWPVKVSTNPDEEVTGWLEGLLPDEGEKASSLYHQYIVSFYFINTIFSTVGFGAPPCLVCACVCVCACARVRVRV